ncbi:MAG: hypothetical protein WDN08_06680 [Rhizomicrobium sp.]
MGYSDGGFLLAGLYRAGFSVAHGPIPHDIKRTGGETAVKRALSWMIDGDRAALEPSLDGPAVAFNLDHSQQADRHAAAAGPFRACADAGGSVGGISTPSTG